MSNGYVIGFLRVLVVIEFIAAAGASWAETPARVPRIGFLVVRSLSDTPSAERAAFLQRMKQLGYEDGKTIQIEYRTGEGNVELLPAAARELVTSGVDLIVAVGTRSAIAAKNATRTIPIVMTHATDPVANGLVASLQRPGGNVTGLAILQPELSTKRLELLKEVDPRLSRVAVLWSTMDPANVPELGALQSAAHGLGIAVEPFDVTRYEDLTDAFRRMEQHPPGAILTLWDFHTFVYRKLIADFALKHRLPTSFPGSASFPGSVEAGGLMSYGPNVPDLFRNAANYVDRILRGAKPQDLPVQQPTHFEFVVNQKTAKGLGIAIPQSILMRADKVIE